MNWSKILVERREAFVLLAVLLVGIVTGTMHPNHVLQEVPSRHLAYVEGEVTELSWGAVPVVHLGIDLFLGERYVPTAFIGLTTKEGKRLTIVNVEQGVMTRDYPLVDPSSSSAPNASAFGHKVLIIYRAYSNREVPWQDIVNAGLGSSYRSGFWGSDQIDGIVEALFVVQ